MSTMTRIHEETERAIRESIVPVNADTVIKLEATAYVPGNGESVHIASTFGSPAESLAAARIRARVLGWSDVVFRGIGKYTGFLIYEFTR